MWNVFAQQPFWFQAFAVATFTAVLLLIALVVVGWRPAVIREVQCWLPPDPPNVEQPDPEIARVLLDRWANFGPHRSSRVLPLREKKTIETEVIW